MSKNDVLLIWLNETVGKKNMQHLETMLTPDFRAKNAMSQDAFDKQELQEFILSICNLFGPVTFSSEINLDQGDWLATRVVVHTSCLTTGRPINYRDHIFTRFEGEKIAEMVSLADYFTLFEQTGQLPVNALAACIGGQPLH